jgi:hypothetical protein
MVEARRGQEHGDEVDDAAQQRKGEQHEQPVHLAPLAHRVDGEKDGDDDVKADSKDLHGVRWLVDVGVA